MGSAQARPLPCSSGLVARGGRIARFEGAGTRTGLDPRTAREANVRLLRSVLADFSGAGTSAGGFTSFAGATGLVEVLPRGLATGPILLTHSGTFVGMPGLRASDAEREVARDTMWLFIVALAFDSLATFDSNRLLHWKGAGPAPQALRTEEEERRLLRVRSFVTQIGRAHV